MKEPVSCFKKSAKYKKVNFIANILFVSILVGTFGYNSLEKDRKNKIYDSLYIGFSEVREIEYGTANYDTLDLVEKVDNGVIDNYTKVLDTSSVGYKELKYEITEEDVTKEYSIQIVVKDTKLPIIELEKESITIYQGSDFDLQSNITSVRDEIDGDLPYSSEALASPNNGYYMISSDFDNDETGTYTVTVTAYDKNGNISTDEYTIKVIEKPVPKVYRPTGSYTGASSVDTSSVVNAALSFVGYKYVYASANPEVGFDCSGFVSYIYSLFGRSLPRTAGGIAGVGNSVSEDNMEPGDIIVWSDNGGRSATHVSIYIGGGDMVHAANTRLGVVRGSLAGWKSSGRNRIISIRRV